jgi:Short C-terminal domain
MLLAARSPAVGEPPRTGPCFNGRMVIFGFGRDQTDDQGEVAPGVCPNCHNQVFLHHVRSKKHVSLYFVPVVPYGTEDYLVCPICSRGLQLSSSQLPYVRSMSGATASFRRRRLPEAQYMAQVERFWHQLGVGLAPGRPGAAPPAPPAQAAPPAAPPSYAPAAAPAGPPPGRPAPPGAIPTPPPAAAAEDETSWISQLQRLAQLRDQGVLSDAQYEAAKRRVLEQKPA